MRKSFGEHLREERKKQGLTVEMVAKACGISRSFVTLIENGKRSPGKQILPKIADALQIKTLVVLNWYLEEVSRKLQTDLSVD